MKKIIIILILICNISIYAKDTITHPYINSTIEKLDTQIWDKVYYQYKIVDNVPYQYNKKKKTYFWNPKYPIIFYKDYLRKYQETKKDIYLKYIERLTKAIMVKSSSFNYNSKKVRTFYYSSTGDVSRMFHKHYSGLTNSYYVNIFSQLYKITNDIKYKEYALEFFNSLTVPINKGG